MLNKTSIKNSFKYTYISENANYVIVTDKKDTQYISVRENQPKCLVIHPTTSINFFGEWPGKLFHVEIINFEEEDSLNTNIIDHAYRRSKLVKVKQELQTHILFGENGKIINDILNYILSINQSKIEQLNDLLTEKSKQLYSKSWINWYLLTNYVNPNPAYRIEDENHLGVLMGYNGSPVNAGFASISALIDKQAIRQIGEHAFEYNKENEGMLNPIWRNAKQVLLNAAMSGGAPHLLTKEENEYMLKAWHQINQ